MIETLLGWKCRIEAVQETVEKIKMKQVSFGPLQLVIRSAYISISFEIILYFV